MVGSLTEWHFAFGDERSTAAALAYLERRETMDATPPDRYRRELAAAWPAALAAIAAARLPHEYGPERERLERRLHDQAALRRISGLIADFERYLLLAQLYLGAAETYDSPAFLGKAETYYAPVQAAHEIIYRNEQVAMADFVAEPRRVLSLHAHRINEIHDLDMRLVIMRARSSRDPADIDAAASVLQRNYSPVLDAAAQQARSHSGEACEMGGEPESAELEALRRACREENSFGRRLTNFWRNQARLDMLMASDPLHYAHVRNRRLSGSGFQRRAEPDRTAAPDRWSDAWETAVWLLRSPELKRDASPLPHGNAAELVLLLVARADACARLAHALQQSDAEEAAERVREALDTLIEAERFSPPHEAPARFRRVATLYLHLWERSGAALNQDWNSSRRSRFASYLQQTLPLLDAIAAGAD
ncbi:MAG TPA: hypothetical protein VF603_06570 [Allosphingosinicella sp.]